VNLKDILGQIDADCREFHLTRSKLLLRDSNHLRAIALGAGAIHPIRFVEPGCDGRFRTRSEPGAD
jgi:hypothetical protein